MIKNACKLKHSDNRKLEKVCNNGRRSPSMIDFI